MMNWKNAPTIIFDLGGVLLNINYHLTTQAFDNLGVTDFTVLYSQAKQSDLFDQFEVGAVSNEVFRDEIRTITNLNLKDDQIDKAWNSMLLDFPLERMEMLERLAQNHQLILMSNTNRIHVEAFTKIIDAAFGMDRFRNVFSEVYFSSSIGKRKPDVETFNWILEKNMLKAGECFFIDDSIQHIEGARKAGINAHWLQENQDTVDYFSGFS